MDALSTRKGRFLDAHSELEALPVLLRHSPGAVLPDRTYVISEEAVQALRQAGVTFTEISKEANAPNLEGAQSGEKEYEVFLPLR